MPMLKTAVLTMFALTLALTLPASRAPDNTGKATVAVVDHATDAAQLNYDLFVIENMAVPVVYLSTLAQATVGASPPLVHQDHYGDPTSTAQAPTLNVRWHAPGHWRTC